MKFIGKHIGIIILAMLAALFLGAVLYPTDVEAQSGCSVASMKGTYSYQTTGFYGGVGNSLAAFASTGTLILDGNGGIASFDTASQNGVITRNRALTGTYQVASSACTGSAVLLSNGQVFANIDFVIAEDGKKLKLIQTDPGTAISGTADLQTLLSGRS